MSKDAQIYNDLKKGFYGIFVQRIEEKDSTVSPLDVSRATADAYAKLLSAEVSNFTTHEEVADSILDVKTYAESLYQKLEQQGWGDIQGTLNDMNNRLLAVREDLREADLRLTNEYLAASARIDAAETRVSAAEVAIDNQSATIAAITEVIDPDTGILTGAKLLIDGQTATLESFAEKVNTHDGTIVTLDTRMSAAEGTITTLADWKDTVSGEIHTMQEQWDVIDATIITTIATELSDPTSEVTTGVTTIADGIAGTYKIEAVQEVWDDIDDALSDPEHPSTHTVNFAQFVVGVNGIHSEVALVKDALDDGSGNLMQVSTIDQKADSISLRVTETEEALSDGEGGLLNVSEIALKAGEIDILVDSGGNVKAGIIVQAINAQTGGSVVTIDADKIALTGEVIANKINAGSGTTISGWLFSGNSISNGHVYLDSSGNFQNRITPTPAPGLPQYYWNLNQDGSGSIAKGNVHWDNAGTVYLAQNTRIEGSTLTVAALSQLSFLMTFFKPLNAQGQPFDWDNIDIDEVEYISTPYNFVSEKEVTAGGIGSGGGGGVSHLYMLEDVPDYRTSYRGKYLRAKSDGSGTEWVDVTGGVSSVINLTGDITQSQLRTALGLGSLAYENSLGWANLTNNANSLEEGTSDVTDNTELLTSYASNNGFSDPNAVGKVYKRAAVHIYNYVKNKLGLGNLAYQPDVVTALGYTPYNAANIGSASVAYASNAGTVGGLSASSFAQWKNYSSPDVMYGFGWGKLAGGSGSPSGAQYGAFLTMPYRNDGTPGYGWQIFGPNGDDSTNPDDIFVRTSMATTWRSWHKLYHSGNCNTTSTPWSASCITVGSTYPQIRGNGTYLTLACGNTEAGEAVVTSNAFMRSGSTPSMTLGRSDRYWDGLYTTSANISGTVIIGSHMYMTYDRYIYWQDNTNGTDRTVISVDNATNFAWGMAAGGKPTYLCGNGISFRYNTAHSEGMILTSSGNVGIGTSSPSYKCHIAGSAYANSLTLNGAISGATTITASTTGTFASIEIGHTNEINSLYSSGNLHIGYRGTAGVISLGVNGSKVGIGTISPSRLFSVSGGSIDIAANVSSVSDTGVFVTNTANSRQIQFIEGTSGKMGIYCPHNGWNIYTNTDNTVHLGQQTYCDSNFIATGEVTAGSDARWKHNITPVFNGIDVVMKLQPSEWKWNSDNHKGSGLIAQQVQAVLPHLVKDDGEGYLHLNYDGLHAYEISAIQSHETEIDRLRKKVAYLESELQRLRN